MSCLLAVDLGLKTGLALYCRSHELHSDGPRQKGARPVTLKWYRSHNYGKSSRLKRGAHTLLDQIQGLEHMVIEGGGSLALIWQREAQRRGIEVRIIGAESWRHDLLLPRQQRTGAEAKHNADELARRVIAWSCAQRPTSLRHDAAEAILIGLWGILQCGWLDELPQELR